jgi:hypothetical protein
LETVTGIFASQADAERAARKLASTLGKDRITVLRPGEPKSQERWLDLDAAEQPGMGKAIGGVIGGSVGVAGGIELGAALTAVVPGVGPVIALGLLGGALLGLAGAEVGGKLENAANGGLPEDEIFVYEDALRRGRSVLVASPEDEATADWVRNLLKDEGAEAIDAAREEWWIGLRSAEREHYAGTGGKFDQDEKFYRLGFEAALHARNRCKEYDQVLAEMQADIEDLQRRYPHTDFEKPFRRGFERGRNYYQRLCDQK